MTTYRYQEDFAAKLAVEWVAGNFNHVRTTIRGLKNKAQASYIAARVAASLMEISPEAAQNFVAYLHPNN